MDLVEGRRRSDSGWPSKSATPGRGSSATRAARTRRRSAVVNRALATTEGLRATLRGWFSFYDGYDPLFTWWVEEPYKAADAAIDAYATASASEVRGRCVVASGEGFGPGGGRRRGAGGGHGGQPREARRATGAAGAPTRPPPVRVKSSATRSAARRFSPSSNTR